ncbi:MAG: amino acid ABC transporter permease [Puniceicoccales bacterium]|jgi:polar amino acid transport system permease protein|nr:amino acid ABC transporter permease [Puniceicoccales bacterium]
MNKTISNFLYIGSGIGFTLKLTFGGVLIGIMGGILLAVLRYSGIGRSFINGIISFLRGTPLLLQLSFIYFIAPDIIGHRFDLLSAGILAFGINSSAYVAEILRAGIESLPKGQFEAARTLEIPRFYMWKDIILPQVVANTFPAMINEIIAVLKETVVIAMMGGMDIMRRAQTVAAEQYEYFLPLCMAGIYYYGLVLLIGFIGKKIENRNYYVKNL